VSRAVQRDQLLESLKLAGRRLSAATIMFHQAVADHLGLNVTDHKCVDFLLMNGPLTAGELAHMTALTTGAITAALDRLERAGFVIREDDPDDRRRVIVRAIPERVGKMARLFDAFSGRLDKLAAGYSAQELTLLVDFMTCTCTSLHESTVELRQPSPVSARKKPSRGRPKKG
jgi:DNA-binding MarR family transcriptional regulator